MHYVSGRLLPRDEGNRLDRVEYVGASCTRLVSQRWMVSSGTTTTRISRSFEVHYDPCPYAHCREIIDGRLHRVESKHVAYCSHAGDGSGKYIARSATHALRAPQILAALSRKVTNTTTARTPPCAPTASSVYPRGHRYLHFYLFTYRMLRPTLICVRVGVAPA